MLAASSRAHVWASDLVAKGDNVRLCSARARSLSTSTPMSQSCGWPADPACACRRYSRELFVNTSLPRRPRAARRSVHTVVMGYQSSKAADEARVAKVKAHLGGPPRGSAWKEGPSWRRSGRAARGAARSGARAARKAAARQCRPSSRTGSRRTRWRSRRPRAKGRREKESLSA